jgi:hypothetical protein
MQDPRAIESREVGDRGTIAGCEERKDRSGILAISVADSRLYVDVASIKASNLARACTRGAVAEVWCGGQSALRASKDDAGVIDKGRTHKGERIHSRRHSSPLRCSDLSRSLLRCAVRCVGVVAIPCWLCSFLRSIDPRHDGEERQDAQGTSRREEEGAEGRRREQHSTTQYVRPQFECTAGL